MYLEDDFDQPIHCSFVSLSSDLPCSAKFLLSLEAGGEGCPALSWSLELNFNWAKFGCALFCGSLLNLVSHGSIF